MNYDQLVIEYLDFEIPPYIRRDEVRLDLPRPARNNVIYTITGVRRCGKTYRMYQLMDDLVVQGVPREKIFHFTFDDDRLEPMGDTTATDVFDAYLPCKMLVRPEVDLSATDWSSETICCLSLP